MSNLKVEDCFLEKCSPIAPNDISELLHYLIPTDKILTILVREPNKIAYDFCEFWEWNYTIEDQNYWCLPIEMNKIGILIHENEIKEYLLSSVSLYSIQQYLKSHLPGTFNILESFENKKENENSDIELKDPIAVPSMYKLRSLLYAVFMSKMETVETMSVLPKKSFLARFFASSTDITETGYHLHNKWKNIYDSYTHRDSVTIIRDEFRSVRAVEIDNISESDGEPNKKRPKPNKQLSSLRSQFMKLSKEAKLWVNENIAEIENFSSFYELLFFFSILFKQKTEQLSSILQTEFLQTLFIRHNYVVVHVPEKMELRFRGPEATISLNYSKLNNFSLAIDHQGNISEINAKPNVFIMTLAILHEKEILKYQNFTEIATEQAKTLNLGSNEMALIQFLNIVKNCERRKPNQPRKKRTKLSDVFI